MASGVRQCRALLHLYARIYFMAYRNKVVVNALTGQEIRFLQTSSDTEGSLLEMEAAFAPFSPEPAAHYHPKQHETFTVLEGSILVRLRGRVYLILAGEQLEIPANTVHAMWNASASRAVVNWKVQPALTTEYFLETGMGLASKVQVKPNGHPPLLQAALLARYYNKVYRLGKPGYGWQKIIFSMLSPVARLAGYKAVYHDLLD